MCHTKVGGGGSLGCPLDDVYIHQVPLKKYLEHSLPTNLDCRGLSSGFGREATHNNLN